jgi:hypothetical protein
MNEFWDIYNLLLDSGFYYKYYVCYVFDYVLFTIYL